MTRKRRYERERQRRGGRVKKKMKEDEKEEEDSEIFRFECKCTKTGCYFLCRCVFLKGEYIHTPIWLYTIDCEALRRRLPVDGNVASPSQRPSILHIFDEAFVGVCGICRGSFMTFL